MESTKKPEPEKPAGDWSIQVSRMDDLQQLLNLAAEAKSLEKETKILTKIYEEQTYTPLEQLNIAANRAIESNLPEDWDQVYQLESKLVNKPEVSFAATIELLNETVNRAINSKKDEDWKQVYELETILSRNKPEDQYITMRYDAEMLLQKDVLSTVKYVSSAQNTVDIYDVKVTEAEQLLNGNTLVIEKEANKVDQQIKENELTLEHAESLIEKVTS